MRESRKTTVPESVAPVAPVAARLKNAARLKQVSERQIIVVIHSKQRAEILRPRLRGFERRNYVWSQLVHDIPGIDQVPLNAVMCDIGGAIGLFARVNVERKTRRREQRDLCPLAMAVNRDDGFACTR